MVLSRARLSLTLTSCACAWPISPESGGSSHRLQRRVGQQRIVGKAAARRQRRDGESENPRTRHRHEAATIRFVRAHSRLNHNENLWFPAVAPPPDLTHRKPAEQAELP